MHNRLKIFILIIFFLAVILFISLIPTIPDISERWFSLLFFVVISMLAEFIPVSLPMGGEITIAFPIDFVVILVFGPALAMIVAVFSIIWEIFGKKESWYKTLFNASQYALATGLAGIVYQYSGGMIGDQNFFRFIIPALLCALAYCIVNSSLVASVISLDSNISITKVYRINIREVLPSYLAEAPLGFIMAIIFVEVGILGILLFFFPLLLARRSFELYTRMRKMYLDTIRSLAAAIDAKDPYTHGHSDRVSKLAVKLARKLNFYETQVENIEYAAILHDIGKIGIEDSILGKKGKLTEKEYQKIKEHPIIGARIIESIEFLKNCSKSVLHHHERYDGKGYPNGLKGEKIPKVARLLVIVDSYDAMNSNRPYREKLTRQKILQELITQSGKQFDPNMVGVFINMLKKEEVL